MLVPRRITRSLALGCVAVAAEPQAVVREVQNGNDETTALLLSGSALPVAIAGAGFTGRTRRLA